MRRNAGKLSACLLVAALVLCAGVGAACEIEAVINWAPLGVPHLKQVSRIHEDGWDQGVFFRLPITNYVAWTGDILLPDDAHVIGKPSNIVVLAGAGAATHPATADYYIVYYWVDVNNNGEADANDKIVGSDGKWHKQNWQELDSGFIEYDYVTKMHKIKDVLSPERGPHPALIPGLTYLLLIRSFMIEGSDSWQWVNGHFVVSRDEIALLDAQPATSGKEWSADVEDNKYGKPPTWRGIDDYEFLVLRINQPPRSPGPAKPRPQ